MAAVEIPAGASGHWIVVDDLGSGIRRGTLRENERRLYLGDLEPGGYFLFWQLNNVTADFPTLPPGEHRLSFLVLPEVSALPADPFFVLSQPGLALAVRDGITSPGTPYAMALSAMRRLAVPRVRTDMSMWLIRRADGGYDWPILEQVERDVAAAGARLQAQIGLTPLSAPDLANGVVDEGEPTPAYIHHLLRRFGFRLDHLVIWNDLGGKAWQGSPEDLVERLAPVYSMVKHRSPEAVVSLGGLARNTAGLELMDADFVELFLRAGTECFDVLDYAAPADLTRARKFTTTINAIVVTTPSSSKPRAAAAAVSAGDDSILARRAQAASLVQKLVWLAHNGWTYAVAGPLVAPPISSDQEFAFFRLRAEAGGKGSVRLEPRLAAGAWTTARRLLAGTSPVTRLSHADSTTETYGFSRSGETIVIVWTPLKEGDLLNDHRVGVSMGVAFDTPVRIFDIMGRDVTTRKLGRAPDGAGMAVVADVEPVYVILGVDASSVKWGPLRASR